MNIKTWFKKPKKLNETTRLYALYGESSNLEYLDNVGKDNAQKIAQNAENIQSNRTSIQSNTTNIQNNKNKIDSLENRIDNLPQSDVDKAYVDRQDNALINRINTNATNLTNNVNTINRNISNVEVTLSGEIDEVKTKLSNELSALKPDVAFLKRTAAKLEGVEKQYWQVENVFTQQTIFNTDINMFGSKILQVGNPINDRDAANKQYVDSVSTRCKVIDRYVTLTMNKKDVSPSRDMYWYDIVANQTVTITDNNFPPNRRYFCLFFLQSFNGVDLTHFLGSITGSSNSNGVFTIPRYPIPPKSICDWHDFYPNNNGVFSKQALIKCVCLEL